MDIRTIAFIGTGVMGRSMAGHLLKKGYRVRAYNRTASKAAPLAEEGATVCAGIAEAVEGADLVISIVGFPDDVRQLYLGEGGILANMEKGAVAIDMTTSTPELAREINEKAREQGITACDAPVTGGDVGARKGSLTVLFGGDKEIFGRVSQALFSFSKNLVYVGLAGSGQLAKAANQIAVAGTMFSVCESIAFAKGCGLDPGLVVHTLTGGAAGSFSMNSYGPRILKGDFAPGFFLKHFVKDLKIALGVAEDAGLHLEGTELALKLYAHLEKEGLGELGTQALYKYYTEFNRLN